MIGVGTIGGSPTDTLLVTVVEGPTAGDIISDASPVRMKKNRNFGSAKTLSSTTLVYKGKDGGTMTGGNDALLVNVTTPRTAVPIDIDLPRGASIGIFIDMKSATATNVYAAIVTHIKSDIA